jgi:hypothetical protein
MARTRVGSTTDSIPGQEGGRRPAWTEDGRGRDPGSPDAVGTTGSVDAPTELRARKRG